MYYYESGAISEELMPGEIFWRPDISSESLADIDGCKINKTKTKFVFFSNTSGISTEITEPVYFQRADGGSW